MVIDQARKGGFRFRTIDEIAENRAHTEPARRESDSELDKKGSQEFVENV